MTTGPRSYARAASGVALRVAALSALALLGLPSAPAHAQIAPGAPAQPSPSTRASLLDTLSLFAGPDGSKQPQDLGINANMGLRLSGNWGVPVHARAGLGAQVGLGLNLSDAAVDVLEAIEGTSRRRQAFVTAGLFQVAGPANWALVYDLQATRYFDTFTVGQLRGHAGYTVRPHDEVGLWFAAGLHGDTAVMSDTPVTLKAVGQINVYARHEWPSGARTGLWLGRAAGHERVVWVLPDRPRLTGVLVYGADLDVPLDSRFSLTGAANFITPTASGTVDAYLGITLHLAGARAGQPSGPWPVSPTTPASRWTSVADLTPMPDGGQALHAVAWSGTPGSIPSTGVSISP